MNSIITNNGLVSQKENIVLRWNLLQGYDYAYNETLQQPRRLDFRHILIENGTDTGIGVAITNSIERAAKPTFGLKPGEGIDLAVNPFVIGQPPTQYIHLFDKNGITGTPSILRSDSNSFVVRYNELMGGHYVQRYYRPTLSC